VFSSQEKERVDARVCVVLASRDGLRRPPSLYTAHSQSSLTCFPALCVTMFFSPGATVDVTLPERFAAAAPPNTTVSLVSTAALQAVGLQVAAVVNSTLAVYADGRVNRSTGVQAWLDGLYTGCNPGQVRRAGMVLGGTC
jgi:hypothetical protein